jgi:hypothetical protein
VYNLSGLHGPECIILPFFRQSRGNVHQILLFGIISFLVILFWDLLPEPAGSLVLVPSHDTCAAN